MDKKGMLLVEETLKMIIAVISLGVLVYFLTSLYLVKVSNEDIRQAEANIQRIDDMIVSLANPTDFFIVSPEGYSLFSFVDEKKPNVCTGENCLCMCDKVSAVGLKFWVSEEERQFNECNEKGICLVLPTLKKFGEINIVKGGTQINIAKEGESVLISKK